MNRFPWPGLAPATLRALLRTALVLDSEPVSSRIPSARRFLAGSLRGLLSVTSLLAAMPGRAVAQSHLFTFAEPQGAYSCAAAGDVDHDGVPDIIVGSDCNGRGKATVYSGRWGTVIWQWFGRTANDNLGISVSGAGDVNRDGYDDVIIGASFQQSVPATAPGYAEIRSGCDGTVLRTLGATAAVGDNFGHFVRNAGDVNGDGYPDQMVGAIQLSNRGAGYVQVFSGQNGAVLRLFQGQAPGDFFGIACDAIGDVDGGGRSEFVVGAHGGSGGRGYVRVFSGETGNLLYQVTGAAVGDHLGVSVSRLGGDVTGDGLPDFAVGTNAPSSATGYALVCSGANGHQFRRLAGTTTGDHFGYQVAAGGDVDVDGIQDLLVGTDRLYRNLPGLVQVYSGQSWQAIRTFVGRGNGDRFGICVASPGDINGDQVPDLMAGSIFPANGGILEVVSGKRLESLVADRHTISRSAGGQVTFACEAGSAHAGNIVVLAGSMTGTSPCIPLSATACLPLVIDAYTSFSLSGGIFIGSPDFLDASGSARVTLSVPPNTWPLGLRVHHAYVVIGNGLASIPMASNAVPLAITQ